jgi:predicted GTPase
VTIQRDPKRFKEDQPEGNQGRIQFNENQVKPSSTPLKKCSDMFMCPEDNEDPKSTAFNKTNPKSILLLGKAGIGKSLFCQKLLRDWKKRAKHLIFSLHSC